MSYSAERDAIGRRESHRLFVLACDQRGKVLWMSDHARSALNFETETVPALPLRTMRLSPVLWQSGKILLGVQALEADLRATVTKLDLFPVERSLIHHQHRLQRAERRLSAQAGSRRGGGRAIRQIELERGRIARELHSGVGQALAAIRLQLDVIQAQVPSLPPLAEQAANRISRLAQEALEQVRAVSRRLHPPEWHRLTLESAIRQLWELSGIPERFQATLDIGLSQGQPDLATKSLVYRTAQEALSNLVRHANATRVEASLSCREGKLVLSVRDNGSGFNVDAATVGPAKLNAGIGLRSIREQAAALGATLEVRSGPSGTTLLLSAPLDAGRE